MSEERSTHQPTEYRPYSRRRLLQSSGVAAATLAVGTGPAAAATVSTSEHTIASWDGTDLVATLYRPASTDPQPAVLMTHGWGLNRDSPLTAEKARAHAENGYVVLVYDSRGFGDSDGTVEMNGPKEVRDARRLIDWLARRDAVALDGAGNPKLGMDGVSYAGAIQPLVAGADDRVDAIVPRITWNDLVYSLGPNGVVKSGWLTALLGLGTFGTFDLDSGASLTQDLYDWYDRAMDENRTPDPAKAAYRERSFAYNLDGFDTPTLLVQGWDDTLFKPLEALRSYRSLRDRGVETRLAFYEGGHTLSALSVPQSARDHMNDLAATWFDRHLRDAGVDVPDASQYLIQQESWRADEQFPPADVTRRAYHLGDADRDGWGTIHRDHWLYGESVTYTWRADRDLELVGTPKLDLVLDVDGPEARLFFTVEHDGEAINGMSEVSRVDGAGRHRIQVEYPPLQRFVTAGDDVELTVSASEPYYLESRESDGVSVVAGDSRLALPQRDWVGSDDDGWW